MSRPGWDKRHAEKLEFPAGSLCKQEETEESEVRSDLEVIPNENQDVVTHVLTSETELQSIQTQTLHLDVEASFVSPVGSEVVNDTVALVNSGQEPQSLRSVDAYNEGPEASESQMPVEPSGYQDNTMERVAYFASQETISVNTEPEREQQDVSPGIMEGQVRHIISSPVQKLTKREKNRLKTLRRKKRKKERWIQSQLEEKVFVKLNNYIYIFFTLLNVIIFKN